MRLFNRLDKKHGNKKYHECYVHFLKAGSALSTSNSSTIANR